MGNNVAEPFAPLLGEEKKESFFTTIIMYVVILLMLSFLFLVSFFQLCRIDGISMQNTLQNYDDVLVTRFDTKYADNDIIILDVIDEGSEIRLVKRLIATAGETFLFKTEGNYVYLYKKDSGDILVKIDETYIKEDMLKGPFSSRGRTIFEFNKEYTVPENQILFLGDNRNDSRDSRFYGFANLSQIVGKVVFVTNEGSFLNNVLNIIFNSEKTADTLKN